MDALKLPKEDTNIITPATSSAQWFALRDLSRPNAKLPAYKWLAVEGFELFTPMRDVVRERAGRRVREKVPFVQDLLFVHTTRAALDPQVERSQTLQYRFQKGAAYRDPIVVRDEDMERFIRAVTLSPRPRFFLPEEIKESMLGATVRVVGGNLDGLTGCLLSIRGSYKKRIKVDIPNFLCSGIEITDGVFEIMPLSL